MLTRVPPANIPDNEHRRAKSLIDAHLPACALPDGDGDPRIEEPGKINARGITEKSGAAGSSLTVIPSAEGGPSFLPTSLNGEGEESAHRPTLPRDLALS